MGQVLILGMKIFPLGGVCVAPQISETIRARKLKFYAHLDRPSSLFGYNIFFR